MFIAILNPHQQFSISLQHADYEFTTSDDGDESGRVMFPSPVARSATFAQIGEELRIYCPKLSKTVWRGQIERIEETEDGSVIWGAIGFGALQRDARVSTAREVNDVKRWKHVGQGFLTGGVDSRLDLWEIEQMTDSSTTQIRMTTKRTFTINNSTLAFVSFLFEQPERYTSAASQDTIYVTVHATTGLATGVRVAPIIAIPQPSGYALTLGTFTNVSTSQYITTSAQIYGWVIGVNAAGNETIAGNTSVRFSAVVNAALPIDGAVLALALTGRGGCCDVHIPPLTYARIEKSDANLRDFIESIDPNLSNVRYHRKRFYRDAPLPTINFNFDSPMTWRFRNKSRIVDISKAPNRVFAEYDGYWTQHLTGTATALSLESRRQTLAWRLASVGKYQNKGVAEAYRDAAATEIETSIAPITVDLNNNAYELMTRNGVCVPNWAADVGDYAEIDNYFRRGKIVARTIARDRTTYDVSFQTDDFVTAIR